MDDGADPAALTDEELAQAVEVFRAALMREHHADWSMETVAEAAHICARSLADVAALRASRAEVERLGEQNDGLYQATLMLGTEVERLRSVADDLAIALHHCSAFLPLFLSEHGEEGRKLARALAVNEQVDVAMKAYCDLTQTRRPDLTTRTVTTTKETP